MKEGEIICPVSVFIKKTILTEIVQKQTKTHFGQMRLQKSTWTKVDPEPEAVDFCRVTKPPRGIAYS